MDKYIIDGVEYSQGEEVEVRDYDNEEWIHDYIIGVNSNLTHKFICKMEKWKQIRKLQPTTEPIITTTEKLKMEELEERIERLEKAVGIEHFYKTNQ